MPRHWILQANPAKWRVQDAIADKYPITSWSLYSPEAKLAAGDDVALWMSGPHGGVLGFGRVSGAVRRRSLRDNPYWADSAGAAHNVWEVPIVCGRLAPTPIVRREVLIRDPRFASSTIITMPGGANPFDVSDSAWDAICDATNKARKNHTAGRSANPPWAADEILLALDFYFQHGSQSPEDSRTIALSAVLRSLPLELSRPDAERFRSPNSLYMKFQNFKALDPDYPGAGLRAGSHLDEELFNRYRGHADKLHALALAIAAAAQRGLPPASLQEEDFAALEGTILVAIHRSLERSGALVAKKKKLGTRADGTISCDVCDFEFSARYGPDLRGFIECHHLLPLAGAPARTTRLRDLALVCANCHRMAHRVVPSRETITELRELLR